MECLRRGRVPVRDSGEARGRRASPGGRGPGQGDAEPLDCAIRGTRAIGERKSATRGSRADEGVRPTLLRFSGNNLIVAGVYMPGIHELFMGEEAACSRFAG